MVSYYGWFLVRQVAHAVRVAAKKKYQAAPAGAKMPSSLHDAYMQAAMAETALRTVANPHDQALAALGVHPALHQASSVPLQSGLVNPHDFPSRFNNGFVNTALQSDCNGGVRACPFFSHTLAEPNGLHPCFVTEKTLISGLSISVLSRCAVSTVDWIKAPP